jgi:hypothetical protein
VVEGHHLPSGSTEREVAMELTGSKFKGGGKAGDFGWMIRQPDYDDALFIFNDNEAEFRAHQDHGMGSGRCHAGGGNAGIRPFQCQVPQRAAGIPTGADGQGYQRLDDHVRGVIDDALLAIRDLVATGRYGRIIYSAENAAGDLGTGIFQVSDDVKRYIVEGLRKLATSHVSE